MAVVPGPVESDRPIHSKDRPSNSAFSYCAEGLICFLTAKSERPAECPDAFSVLIKSCLVGLSQRRATHARMRRGLEHGSPGERENVARPDRTLARLFMPRRTTSFRFFINSGVGGRALCSSLQRVT